MGQKYFDNVWCDVVLMDAYHILLGRQWKFDRSVVHNSRKNTYIFSIKGKSMVLAPGREKTEMKVDSMKNMLSLSQFIEEIRSEREVFALMLSSTTLKEEEEEDDNLEKMWGVLEKSLDLRDTTLD